MQTIKIIITTNSLFVGDETPELTDHSASIAMFVDLLSDQVHLAFPDTNIDIAVVEDSSHGTVIEADHNTSEYVHYLIKDLVESGAWYVQKLSLLLALEQSSTTRAEEIELERLSDEDMWSAFPTDLWQEYIDEKRALMLSAQKILSDEIGAAVAVWIDSQRAYIDEGKSSDVAQRLGIDPDNIDNYLWNRFQEIFNAMEHPVVYRFDVPNSPTRATALWMPKAGRIGIAHTADADWASVGSAEEGIALWLQDPEEFVSHN